MTNTMVYRAILALILIYTLLEAATTTVPTGCTCSPNGFSIGPGGVGCSVNTYCNTYISPGLTAAAILATYHDLPPLPAELAADVAAAATIEYGDFSIMSTAIALAAVEVPAINDYYYNVCVSCQSACCVNTTTT